MSRKPIWGIVDDGIHPARRYWITVAVDGRTFRSREHFASVEAAFDRGREFRQKAEEWLVYFGAGLAWRDLALQKLDLEPYLPEDFGHLETRVMRAKRWVRELASLELGTDLGERFKAGAAVLARREPSFVSEVLNIIGSLPSSEPELRALQDL